MCLLLEKSSQVIKCIKIISILLFSQSLHKLHVLGHYRDAFGVNGTDICVLEQTHQICFCSFLESKKSHALKAHYIKQEISNDNVLGMVFVLMIFFLFGVVSGLRRYLPLFYVLTVVEAIK